MARLRKRRSRRFKMPEISLTPLIDTALTLLIIFMVTAPMVQNSIKLDLPKGKSKEVGAEQEIVISVTRDDKLFFNSYPVDKGELVMKVKDSLKNREDLPVYVRADEKVSYGRVIELVDELKQAGVQYVAMSTRAVRE